MLIMKLRGRKQIYSVLNELMDLEDRTRGVEKHKYVPESLRNKWCTKHGTASSNVAPLLCSLDFCVRNLGSNFLIKPRTSV